jgi:xylulokinase
VFELPVEVPAQVEGAAFGAALQALWACDSGGGNADLAAITREHVQLEPGRGAWPNAQAAGGYRTAYQRFQRQLAIELEQDRTPRT